MAYFKSNKTGIALEKDRVMTPDFLAKFVVDYFKPSGVCLEPCKGEGSIYNYLPEPKLWCEIDDGRDFFDFDVNLYKKIDWIITNPPFSIYDKFLRKCWEVADNVVVVCPLQKLFKSQNMDKSLVEYGGLKEIVVVGGGHKFNFPFGFLVGFMYFKRGYVGDIKLTRRYDLKKSEDIKDDKT